MWHLVAIITMIFLIIYWPKLLVDPRSPPRTKFLWSIAVRSPIGWTPLTDTMDKRTQQTCLNSSSNGRMPTVHLLRELLNLAFGSCRRRILYSTILHLTSISRRMTPFSFKTCVNITQKFTTAESYRRTGHKSLQFNHHRLTLIPTSWNIKISSRSVFWHDHQRTNTTDKNSTNRDVVYVCSFVRQMEFDTLAVVFLIPCKTPCLRSVGDSRLLIYIIYLSIFICPESTKQ